VYIGWEWIVIGIVTLGAIGGVIAAISVMRSKRQSGEAMAGTTASVQFCPKCGRSLFQETAFCPHCGNRLK